MMAALSFAECALPSQGEEPACFADGTSCGGPSDASAFDAATAIDATSADGAPRLDADSASADAPGDTSTPRDAAKDAAADSRSEAIDSSSDGSVPDAGDGAPDGTLADAFDDGQDTDGAGDEGRDADASDAAADALVDTGTECNDLTNGAQPVAEVDVAATEPAATGGTIVGGTYFLTSYTVYGGSMGGVTVQATLSVAPTDLAGPAGADKGTIQSIENDGAGDVTYTDSYQIILGALHMTRQCGDAGSIFDMPRTGVFGYTATPTQITLNADSANQSVVLVFEKQ
jgi:hypothetical protein